MPIPDHMDVTRRYLLAAGAAVVVTGCEQAVRTSGLPDVAWPGGGSPPPSSDTGRNPGSRGGRQSGSAADPIDRGAWAKGGQGSNINPMDGVRRLTVHHEGSPDPITFSSYRATVEHLERVRRFHRSRGWADIGYHYIIDRAGRVWEGRPVRYQGAHVKDHNEHNVGVMVMGNFNIQRPSSAQLETLPGVVSHLRSKYNVRQKAIYTHRELGPTTCPGAHLQPKVDQMRRTGAFA